eukprot:2314764-Amphidinium_carterae.1
MGCVPRRCSHREKVEEPTKLIANQFVVVLYDPQYPISTAQSNEIVVFVACRSRQKCPGNGKPRNTHPPQKYLKT